MGIPGGVRINFEGGPEEEEEEDTFI